MCTSTASVFTIAAPNVTSIASASLWVHAASQSWDYFLVLGNCTCAVRASLHLQFMADCWRRIVLHNKSNGALTHVRDDSELRLALSSDWLHVYVEAP